MYAEYPDGAANMTSNNAGESTDGDVVPDPDALRQDADEAEERERASLAADPDPRGMQFIGQATGVVAVADEVLPSGTNVDVVMDPVAGDIRVAGGVARVGAAAGRMLDAGFEHSAVVEGGAGRDALLDLPVDPDLRERDRLDGDVYRDRERAELQLHHQGAAGKQVVVVGAALALVAQFLCMASAARRLRPGHRVDVSTAVLFNVELALVTESLVFMLGVQAVGDPLRCAWVALALHYLHLVAAGWFLANVGYIVYRLRVGRLPAYFRPVAFTVWVCPAVLVSAMYIAQPRSYETHRYCWMAVQRGLLLTFVAPVAVLVMINAGLTMRGLCAVSRRRQRQPDEAEAEAFKGLVTAAAAAEQEALEGGGGGAEGGGGGGGGALVPEDERDACTAAELRSSLRAAAAMLPLYSADWFLGVVAMDNSTFMTYPLCFLVSNGFLNWFLMVCAWLIVPRESNKEGGDFCGGGDGDDLDDEEEMLLEEEEAGCWGKPSSPSASLLDNAYGTAFGAAFDERAACAALWAAGDVPSHGPITAEPHASADGSAAAAAAPRWEGADYYMTDVDLGSGGGGHLQRPEAAAGVPSAVIQELAEMRYDGGISTITT